MLGWASPARATERLAVLELSGKSLSDDERGVLTDSVRGAVVGVLSGRVAVMTRENMEVMLSDMGKDASCVSEGACEVETARNLGVDYVISGSVAIISGTEVVSLKLMETRTGQMLGSKQVLGANALELMQTLEAPSRALVAPLMQAAPAPSPRPAAAAPKPAPPKLPDPPKPVVSGTDWTSPTLGAMKWIPAGTFTMGAAAEEGGGSKDELPHMVTVSRGYWMMEHEVTQGEWQAVMKANPSKFTGCGAKCPVEQVSWDEVAAFVKAASARDGVAYRLPTEAEWERAARGGQSGERYAGGDEPGEVAWTFENSDKAPHAVCGKARNAYGLCDMSGNVGEWTADLKGAYPKEPVTDPVGGSSGSTRVFRGGSWDYTSDYARAAYRGRLDAGFRNFNLGFRLVMSDQPGSTPAK